MALAVASKSSTFAAEVVAPEEPLVLATRGGDEVVAAAVDEGEGASRL